MRRELGNYKKDDNKNPTNVEEEPTCIAPAVLGPGSESNDDRYPIDLNTGFVSPKWINAAPAQNDNGFVESITMPEQEAQLLDRRELGALSGADMNRIDPRYFPKFHRALNAVKKEVVGLMQVHNG